jgi:hypothetical protein
MSSTGMFSQGALLRSLATLILYAPVCLAQTATGSITGAAVDPTGARIAEAHITLVNTETKAARSVLTNELGYFTSRFNCCRRRDTGWTRQSPASSAIRGRTSRSTWRKRR